MIRECRSLSKIPLMAGLLRIWHAQASDDSAELTPLIPLSCEERGSSGMLEKSESVKSPDALQARRGPVWASGRRAAALQVCCLVRERQDRGEGTPIQRRSKGCFPAYARRLNRASPSARQQKLCRRGAWKR